MHDFVNNCKVELELELLRRPLCTPARLPSFTLFTLLITQQLSDTIFSYYA